MNTDALFYLNVWRYMVKGINIDVLKHNDVRIPKFMNINEQITSLYNDINLKTSQVLYYHVNVYFNDLEFYLKLMA